MRSDDIESETRALVMVTNQRDYLTGELIYKRAYGYEYIVIAAWKKSLKSPLSYLLFIYLVASSW